MHSAGVDAVGTAAYREVGRLRGQAVEMHGSGMGGSALSQHNARAALVLEDAVLPHIFSFSECDAGPTNERLDQGRVEPAGSEP